MVDRSVISDITHTQLLPLTPSTAWGAASERAFPARVRPMIMATGPVMEAGRIRSTALWPQKRTRSPAAMDTSPDSMIPNCA